MATSAGDNMPIYIRVDEPSMLKAGVVPDMVFDTVDALEEYNGEFVRKCCASISRIVNGGRK